MRTISKQQYTEVARSTVLSHGIDGDLRPTTNLFTASYMHIGV